MTNQTTYGFAKQYASNIKFNVLCSNQQPTGPSFSQRKTETKPELPSQITNRYTSAFCRDLCRAFAVGDPTPKSRRPSIPAELIIYIFRLVGFCVPAPGLTISVEAKKETFCVSSNGPLVRQLWFYTPPLTQRLLGKIAAVRLVTESTHQGWVSNTDAGSGSWWEVGILRGVDTQRRCLSENQTEMEYQSLKWHDGPVLGSSESTESGCCEPPLPVRTCVSHHHDVKKHLRIQTYASGRIADRFLVLDGPQFGRDHELWNGVDDHNNFSWMQGSTKDAGPVRVGDRLAVYGCAQFWGWECYANWAKLEFDIYWEPGL